MVVAAEDGTYGATSEPLCGSLVAGLPLTLVGDTPSLWAVGPHGRALMSCQLVVARVTAGCWWSLPARCPVERTVQHVRLTGAAGAAGAIRPAGSGSTGTSFGPRLVRD
ncbi:hypothetical protein AB0C13_26895 [Streptomyces sp. NPDC049099]|uniref:hypothetical protein n=1 Tax=Streptomyces sp. NPDC049099 TaxID=3155768 RepID=UPI00341806DE